jgi:hypothetical protein
MYLRGVQPYDLEVADLGRIFAVSSLRSRDGDGC